MTQKTPSAHHRTNLSACIFATKACIDSRTKLLNSNTSSTCLHNMANFGPLTAEIGSGVWGTPANFNGLRVMPSLLQRRRSPEANQTWQDVWPSLWGSCSLSEFCPVQNSLYIQLLRSPVLAALLHGTPAAGVSQTLRRGKKNAITQLSQRVPLICGPPCICCNL